MEKKSRNVKLIDQIMKKYIFEDDPGAIVGTEIRLRRNGQSKTLDAICQKTCSVSYLSKLEKNEIKANPHFLEEICKRLKLTKENIEIINNSKALFDSMIKADFEGRRDAIYDAYLKTQSLKNYRARIIEFYYYVVTDDLNSAKRLYEELDRLVGSMLINDLIIFAYIEALYHKKLNELHSAYSLLTGLENLVLPFKYLDCLVKQLKVKILYKINSNLFLSNVKILKDLYFKNNAYDQMNDIDLMTNNYMVRNGYFDLLSLDENQPKDHDYLLYEEIVNDDELHNRPGYSNFARLLYLKEINDDSYDEQYKLLADNLTDEQSLILNVTKRNVLSEEYYHEMIEIYYPMALATGDEIIISIVENELVLLLQYKKRYKRIIEIYLNSDKRRKEVGFFC